MSFQRDESVSFLRLLAELNTVVRSDARRAYLYKMFCDIVGYEARASLPRWVEQQFVCACNVKGGLKL
jgi:hypothetical protein